MSRRKIPNLIARKKKQEVRKFTGMTHKQWSEWCERRAEGKRFVLRVFEEFFREKKDEEKTVKEADEGLPAAVSSEGLA